MRKLVFLLLLLPCISFSQTANEKKVKAMVENLKSKNYAAIHAEFDTSLQKQLDTMRLRRMWENLLNQNGALKSVGAVETNSQLKSEIVSHQLELEKRKLELKVIFNGNGKAKGFNFVPAMLPRAKYQMPPYGKPDQMEERRVDLVSGAYSLAGMLTVPKAPGRYPVVILVHGMGPNDRDETVGPLKIFKDLSIGLTSNGIAVYRYDKRTKQYGFRSLKEKNFTVKNEVLDDVLAAITAVKADSAVDTNRIFLCGHTYGAMLLPRIAEQANVAGYIFLAPGTRPTEDMIMDQAEMAAKDATSPRQLSQLDTMRSEAKRIKALKDKPANPADSMLLRFPVTYWADLANYDPVKEAQKIKKPLLVLYGERDYQVQKSEFTTWKTSVTGKSITYKSYPDLNHFFIEGKEKSTPEEYKKAGNVSVKVINDISAWLKGIK